MIKIGLTGGIGVGKTTILKEFAKLKIPTYVMDDRLKILIKERPDLRSRLIEFLGPDVFDENNEYNRKYVARVIFNDPVKKTDLGLIFDRYLRLDLYSFYNDNLFKEYVIVESAIFYEYHMEELVDLMVGVDASEETRLYRIKARNPDLTPEQIKDVLKNQMDQSEKMTKCDFVIMNEKDNELDFQTVEHLHRLFYKINKLKRNIYM